MAIGWRLEPAQSQALRRMLVLSAILEVLSPGQWPVREELHARDPGLQACYRRVTVPESVFHRLNDNTHSLLVAEV